MKKAPKLLPKKQRLENRIRVLEEAIKSVACAGCSCNSCTILNAALYGKLNNAPKH